MGGGEGKLGTLVLEITLAEGWVLEHCMTETQSLTALSLSHSDSIKRKSRDGHICIAQIIFELNKSTK